MRKKPVQIVFPDGSRGPGTISENGTLTIVGGLGIFLEVHDILLVDGVRSRVVGIGHSVVTGEDHICEVKLKELPPNTGLRRDPSAFGAVSGATNKALTAWVRDVVGPTPLSRPISTSTAKSDDGDYVDVRVGIGPKATSALVLRAVIRDGKPVLKAVRFDGTGAEINDAVAIWMEQNPSIG